MNNPEPEQNHVAQIASALSDEGSDRVDESRSEIERLKEEIERLNHELRREREMCVRNLADFDNYRRRVERERAQAAQAGKRELVLPLLEVMDEFERALKLGDDDPQSAVAEARMIYHRLTGLLATQCGAAFDSQGKRLTPPLREPGR